MASSIPSARTISITLFAMVAFAANSLLCRAALRHTGIDAASFTAVRLVSGAAMLGVIVRLRRGEVAGRGSWLSALALFVYAAGFSFAYLNLAAATGALLLFGAVQTTMIGYGICKGERLNGRQLVGLFAAVAGLVSLLLPGLSAPPLLPSVLMLSAGGAWGIYSLRGRGEGDPTRVTAGNFLRAVPMAAVLSLALFRSLKADAIGICYGVASGAVASGVGYALWYRVVPAFKRSHAATIQLSVPVLAAVGGIIFLGEAMTLRLALASTAVISGIAILLTAQPKPLLKKVTPCPACAGIGCTEELRCSICGDGGY